jgi:hypothetical protein
LGASRTTRLKLVGVILGRADHECCLATIEGRFIHNETIAECINADLVRVNTDFLRNK